MRVDEDGSDQRTLWCGNISDKVTDEILYELFLQAGPLESLRRPRDPNGRPKSFAFIVYKHECSVPYALELLSGEKLFNRALNLSSRSSQHHIPVLDTHLNEFTDRLEDKSQIRKEGRDHRNNKRRSDKERDDNEPTSWAELNSLRGKGSLLNGHLMFKRDDLLGAPMHSKESKSRDAPACVSDIERLLQMGSQLMPSLMHPGMLPFGGPPIPAGGSLGPVNLMGSVGLSMGSVGLSMGPLGHSMGPVGHSTGPVGHSTGPMVHSMGLMGRGMGPVGHNIYPSMQGRMSGGKRFSPEKERRRSDYYEGRSSRRDHPYQDKRQGSQYDNRRHSDNNYNHRRHDRGFSSSRSSHERERRDRRSR